MTNFDTHNKFNLRMRNSKIQWMKLKNLKEHNETNWWSFDDSFAGCLRNINKF